MKKAIVTWIMKKALSFVSLLALPVQALQPLGNVEVTTTTTTTTTTIGTNQGLQPGPQLGPQPQQILELETKVSKQIYTFTRTFFL